jgi:hypothetical protein
VRAVRGALGLLLALASTASAGRGIGTDLTALNPCMYGDCEARGTYAADPYGLYNPATMGVATHMYFARGAALSGSYYHLDVGDVDGDLEAGVVTATGSPVAFQVATVYAEARGPVRPLPGVGMSFRTRVVRLAAAIDAEPTLGIRGLSLGLAGVVPGTESDLRLSLGGHTFVRSTETRALELIPGFHWHNGERDWFMVGGFLDATRNDVTADGFDPATATPLHRRGHTNAWFARLGVSLLPFIPLRLADGGSVRAEWLGAFRLATDVEYRDVTVPGESSLRDAAAYFGADAPLVPDRLNPLARWIHLEALAGVDSRGGWGAGAGVYGRGSLAFLGCNGAYSSRPLTGFIGKATQVLAVTCGVMIPM